MINIKLGSGGMIRNYRNGPHEIFFDPKKRK